MSVSYLVSGGEERHEPLCAVCKQRTLERRRLGRSHADQPPRAKLRIAIGVVLIVAGVLVFPVLMLLNALS